MYITGGILKGRKLDAIKGEVRPLTARIRHSLFDTLDSYMSSHQDPILGEKKFLDLFAGSGILSAEALSRDFDSCTIVEKDMLKQASLRQTKNMLSQETHKQVRLCIQPVERFILSHSESYLVVFLDPPYRYLYKAQLLKRLAKSRILNEQSLVIMHLPTQEKISEIDFEQANGGVKNNSVKKSIETTKLSMIKEKRYGGAKLYFYKSQGDYWSDL